MLQGEETTYPNEPEKYDILASIQNFNEIVYKKWKKQSNVFHYIDCQSMHSEK